MVVCVTILILQSIMSILSIDLTFFNRIESFPINALRKQFRLISGLAAN